MGLRRLQGIRSVYKNQLLFYTLAMKKSKNEIKKQSDLQWPQKEKVIRNKFNK